MAAASTPQKRTCQGNLVGEVELEKAPVSEKKRRQAPKPLESLVHRAISRQFSSWPSFAVDGYTVNGETLRQRVTKDIAAKLASMEMTNKKSRLSSAYWNDRYQEYQGALTATGAEDFLASSIVVVVAKLVLQFIWRQKEAYESTCGVEVV